MLSVVDVTSVASTVGTLAGALAGSVSADEVVRSTERGGGSDVISDSTLCLQVLTKRRLIVSMNNYVN